MLDPPQNFDQEPEPGAPNRRVGNLKLKALGWSPRFPSYRDGLPAAVNS